MSYYYHYHYPPPVRWRRAKGQANEMGTSEVVEDLKENLWKRDAVPLMGRATETTDYGFRTGLFAFTWRNSGPLSWAELTIAYGVGGGGGRGGYRPLE